MSVTFEQERHVELVAGANEAFLITTRIVSASIPADLPHLNVFVVNVVDVDDPKQDTLARIGGIADLTTIPIGRDAGIATPGPDGMQYLSASWTSNFDSLEVGLDGAQAFRDRLNALVVAWQSFTANFNAPDPTPAVYVIPAVDTSQKTVLIAAYKTAKQDRYQKQLTKVEADAVLLRAQTDLTYKQGLVSSFATTLSGGTMNVTEMSTMSGYFTTLKAAGDTFAAENPAGVGIATFQAALNTAAVQVTQVSAFLADATALALAISSYNTARQGEVVTAQGALATVTTDQATKAQQLISAQALEATTLAAVLAVCPDFDKHSIPFVDDTEP